MRKEKQRTECPNLARLLDIPIKTDEQTDNCRKQHINIQKCFNTHSFSLLRKPRKLPINTPKKQDTGVGPAYSAWEADALPMD